MSKSSTASGKIPTQLPSQSAWAKGPPQSSSSSAPSPRSQSPAPYNVASPVTATHSRRPSALGQGVPIKDGVTVPRNNVGSVRQGSAVTFGSIDDVAAPISSSPAATPAVKTESVKAFGSVQATAQNHVNGKTPAPAPAPGPSKQPSRPALSAASTSSSVATTSANSSSSTSTPSKTAMGKVDIAKLFQGSSSSSSQPPSDTSSPSTRPANLPSQQHHQPTQSSGHPPQSSQLGAHPYTPFVPGIRQQQQSGASPRSPAFPRAPLNGAGPPRPGGGPGGPMPASPRLAHAPHPHPGQPAGMPPQPVMQQWAPYYYPMDPYAQQPQYWGYMQPPPHMHQQPHPPHTPHPPPPGPQSPHPSMMSPRNHPPPLPGTPTMTPAVPNPPHTPHPPPSHSHQPSNSVSAISPPPTPSTANAPGGRSLNTNANAFVPGGRGGKVTIKSEDGTELNLEALKKTSPNPPTIPIPPPSPAAVPNRRTASVRIESEESKRKRLEETQRKEQEKKDAEERAKKEEEEKKRLEEEAKRKEEEEAERKKQEEEQERIRKEEEEKERIRHEEEEKERIRKEEEEARLEEERRQVAEKEAEERRQQEELEREEAQLEAEEANDTVEAPSPAEESAEPEDGEVVENGIATPEHLTNGDSESKLSKAKEALRIDTSSMPPPSELPRRRPGPLDLTSSKKDIPAGPQSALATARHIEDLSQIEYPQGIKSPSVELNANAKDKKFRYDREFLLQFMIICKEKPDHLPPLDVLGIEPVDQSSFAMARGGSGRHRQASGAMTPSSARQNSVGLGIVGGFGGKPGAGPGGFAMGQFSTPTSKLSSEERFAMSAPGVRSASMGSAAGMQFGRPPMTRTSSQGGPGGHAMGKRTRSKRGVDRNDGNKVPPPQQGQGSSFGGHGGQGAPAFGVQLEPVAPLEVSANRWVAGSTSRKPQADVDSPELVDRKVKALLNKLTMEKFDSISNQIIAWANKSEMEKDGRTLIQVIRLVFEKATDEAAWSEMYARLCRKMMEQISPEVQDDGIKNADGKPIAGGQLFRKYLLNRCQEDFERGWFAKEAAAAAAAAKASDDEATKAANEKKGADGEAELYSDEYYIAQKAKRQGLGLIKFIGELFKLQMLTERIMHECVKKLLGNVENPEEEEIESLCQLLKTVGQILDNPKARAHMDVYFTRMKEFGKSTNVSSRMQFMLQDVIELRERKWVSRKEVAAPTTIAAVHEAAAKEKAVAEKESYQRQMSMSRGGSRRGGDRNQELGPDGWAVAGSVPRPPPKAGDLSNFGKINKAAPMTFGPSSVFAGKKDAAASKRESLSRTSSSQNMFSMLSQNPELAAEASGKPSRSGSRKSSVDFGQTGLPEAPPTRRKLQLLPRSKPAEESTPAASEDEPDSAADGSAAPAAMSEADAKKRVDEDVKEFFAVRNLEEADVYFTNLTPEHRFRLIDKLVGSALESKEADARLVGDFFSQVVGKAQVDADTFEEGFMPMAELLDDIAIDAPKAFDYMAIMLRGAGFDKDEERLGRITGKSMDSDKLLQLVTSP
ncbi:hypothetical protein BV22DRAFT_1126335 [Leucogyrophana mollusca]|uniref:Uncharacterized protein n=1 Tax=Leucogyrophana mollusca TaxID=85980 RepID=A0ACB8BT19_9AGAM|nr:hypothetical protein BV22DRAFT_1126335 [Leucogyrophana mollusca]